MQQIITCTNCGAQNASSQQFCTSCGTRLVKMVPPQLAREAPSPSQATVAESPREALPPQRYQLLGSAATIFKIIGWVVLIGGVLGSIAVALLMSLGALAQLAGLMVSVMGILGLGAVAGAGQVAIVLVGVIVSLLLGLGMLAFADLCNAVRAIEDRSRAQE